MEDRIFLEETIKDLEIRNMELQKMVDDQLMVVIRGLEGKAATWKQRAEEWQHLAMERAAEIEDQKATINALNDHYFEQKEIWEEKVAFMRKLTEENQANWQDLHDREIVMGEKIKLLKAIAKECDPYEPADAFVLLDKIENL